MICHKDFQRMMLDAEIYVDRIADMRITNMNAAMEAVRQSVIKKKGNGNNFIAISSRVRFHSIWIRTLFLPFLITTRILIDKNDYNDYNGD
ncbi:MULTISPECIES: hypothetical protein [Lachnospiraceae]|uniref:hypothetical protein n=1 Tax=Lachnospiraceae TaxID=186803 RepID=UPI0018F6D5D9|nr:MULTISPECIES: hypothetical protein [Lachnospiraceae]MCB5527947.1 hypothetical protein [Fusicatenibacter saccharivorans]MCB5673672.1 hypothetical protein [Fusicatenibacter saccharivorans]MCB5692925.1 hypothetical protein [Fusicatenibacter saccharivorans]MCB5696455.1 hypothetical protein [Fusicatenibacter saccharivorans]MCC2732050.1 hypothetical protein [Fusicatenibacter saccharivorans]